MRPYPTHALVHVALIIGLAAPAAAQDPHAAEIARAEAAGGAHPRAAEPKRVAQGFTAQNWWGSDERRCITGRDLGPVRSGEFMIGGQLGDQRPLYHGAVAKIWWAPLHLPGPTDSLIVRGTNLSTGDTATLVFRDRAWPVTPGALPVPEHLRDYFFPSGTLLPSAGRWMLVATSGANWGCFLLTAT